MALIGNARQATSEGKSGRVETGLTGPAAMALHFPYNTTQVSIPSRFATRCFLGYTVAKACTIPRNSGDETTRRDMQSILCVG